MEDFDRKKPEPDFVIRFVAPSIRPWRVPMRALARAMQAIQRLVDQRDEDENDMPSESLSQATAILEETSRSLRLVDVRTGSAAYAIAAPSHDVPLQIIRETGAGIESPDKFAWRSSSLSAVKELSEIAKSLDCVIEFNLPGSGRQFGDVLAKITPNTFGQVSANVFIMGYTSIYAKIERVGGATEMHCGIRLPDHPRKMVICHVANADLVRQLGQYMYQHLLLSGQASWLKSNQQLRSFTVDSFEPPKTGSIKDAMERIYEAGGDAWDKVKDPDAMISEIRGN